MSSFLGTLNGAWLWATPGDGEESLHARMSTSLTRGAGSTTGGLPSMPTALRDAVFLQLFTLMETPVSLTWGPSSEAGGG